MDTGDVHRVLVSARDHAPVHGVHARVSQVVARHGVDLLLSGVRKHGHQSVHIRRHERELQERPQAPRRASKGQSSQRTLVYHVLDRIYAHSHHNGPIYITYLYFIFTRSLL